MKIKVNSTLSQNIDDLLNNDGNKYTDTIKVGNEIDNAYKINLLHSPNLLTDNLINGVTNYQTGEYSTSTTRLTQANFSVIPAGTYTVGAYYNSTRDMNVSLVTFDMDDQFYDISGISGQWKNVPYQFTTSIPLKIKTNVKDNSDSTINPNSVEVWVKASLDQGVFVDGQDSGILCEDVNGNVRTKGKMDTRSIVTGHINSWGLDVLGNAYITGTSFTGKRNADYNGGNTNNYPWHRIATTTAGTNLWNDKDAIIEIKGNYDTSYYGLIKVSLRTNGSGSAASASARWLIRSGFASTDLVIARWGVSGTNNVYADVYLKSPGGYPRMKLFLLEEQYLFTLVTSEEKSNTTTSDKKGSVECYKDVATAATELRGQAYTATANGVDVAGTGRIANYLTNPTSGTTYYPFFDSIGDGAGGLRAARSNDGLAYYTLDGTVSVVGNSILSLGNGTASGTAHNKKGQLRIFTEKTGCVRLQGTATSTSDNTATFPAETGTVQMKPTNLYNNTSGTTGNITLSQTSANFAYLEIFFGKYSEIGMSSVKVQSPNGKKVCLSQGQFVPNGSVYQNVSKMGTISGTNITFSKAGIGNIYSGGIDVITENQIYVYRVDGWK